MINHEPAADQCETIKSHVVPLPIALYVSNGLVFELYDGGQLSSEYYIRWERLKPIAKLSPHQDDLSGQ